MPFYLVLALGLVALTVNGEDKASRQDNGSAFKNWTKLDRDKGYVVFEFSTIENLPASHVPTPDGVLRKVICALARDEFESVQFGVHALAVGIKEIRVQVESDLKVIVYRRINPVIKKQLATLYEEGNGIAEWMPSEVLLQRGNVFEDLPAGQSVNFWLTFHAEAETKEGIHRGKIRIKPAGKQETVLGLELKVRPFKLQRPRVAFGMYFREDMLPKRFGGLKTQRKAVLAMYRDMAVHGHNSSWFYPMGGYDQLPPRNDHVLNKLLPLAQQAGLLDPDIPSFICGGIPGGLHGEQLKAAVDWLEKERRKQGWPEMIVFGADEPSYPRDVVSVRKELKRMRGIPVRVNMDISGATGVYGYSTTGLCDVQTIMAEGVMSSEMRAEARRMGTQVWTYSFATWREDFDPLRQRYLAGLYTWAHKLQGNFVWAYHHHHHRHAWFAPDSDEPMPVTGWEARRDGIDDYRYLQMVEDSVAANPNKVSAIKAAKWLEVLRARIAAVGPRHVKASKPLALSEYAEIGDRAADYIRRLGPVPNNAVNRAPIPHVKDEAAGYRGKSVKECMAGLASPKVSERRGAAWALFEMGPKGASATELLARALDDPEVRMPALHALEAIGPDAHRAVPRLTALLEHPDFYVRIGATFALAEIGCPLEKRERSVHRSPSRWAPIVVEPLVAVFQDDYPQLAYTAGEILSAMGRLAKPALPAAITMLDGTSNTHRSAAIGLITCLGPDAAAAVPRLIEMHNKKPKDTGYINALAAIGPAASAAIPVLEKYAAKKNPGPEKADYFYALICIRGEDSDLQKLITLLKDAEVQANTKNHVVKLLNQMGTKARSVADEIRQLLSSGKFSDQKDGLQSFLEKVKKGEAPGSPFKW